ncbi:MAG: trehalose-phosphatase, partial [Thermoguttaceae bacterium]
VVGVARSGERERLQQSGADRVVGSFEELTEDADARNGPRCRPPSALDSLKSLQRRLEGKRLALFLDYDGTLTPIVARPEDAAMHDAMRRTVRRLAELTPVAVVSGRDRADVESLVGLPELIYAGSHGFDIRGPDLHREHEGGRAALPELDEAENVLGRELAAVEGAQVERKRFAVAVHYRNVPEEKVEEVRRAVERFAEGHRKLLLRGGKKIFELQPDIDWHKGKAVLWLLEVLGLDSPDVVPMYLGDDVTDEDAFAVLEDRGIGVVVGDDTLPSHADYWLADTDQVRRFLAAWIQTLERRQA